MDFSFIKRFTAQAIIVASVGLFFLTINNSNFMATCFAKWTYYILLALVVLWVLGFSDLLKDLRPDLRSFFRTNAKGLLVSLLLSAAISVSVETHFRVLSDESNYMGVSKAMVFEKRTEIITEGSYYYRTFWPSQRAMEKRPLLFPFATHLLHVFLGYRVLNVFILNFLTLFGILFLLYILLRKVLEDPWVFCALLLTAAQPIISITANSGCLDLFNVLFIIVSFASLVVFHEKPSVFSFRFLWFSLLMLAHIRYESFIFFLITMVFLAATKKIKLGYFKDSIAMAATPLLILPLIWQRILKYKDFDLPEGTIFKAFGLNYFTKFSQDYFKSFSRFDFSLPYATLVNILGAISIIYFLIKYAARAKEPSYKRDVVLVSALCVLALWVLTMSYYFGDIVHPTSARFFILFCILYSVFTAFLLREMAVRLALKPALFVVLSMCAFVIYHPIAVQDRFTNALFITRQYQFIDEFLKRQPDKNFMLIHDRPNNFVVNNYGSVSTAFANANPGLIMAQYNNRLFSEIFVVQEIEYKTLAPTPTTLLNPVFRLRSLEELQNSPNSFMRISKIVNPRSTTRPPETAPPPPQNTQPS